MEEKNKDKILEKVIRYFTDMLGFPRENLIKNPSFLIIEAPISFDLGVYIFGELKILVEINDVNTPDNIIEAKEMVRVYGLPYYLLTDGINHFWIEPNNLHMSHLPYYEEFRKIHTIHEEIFTFLKNKRKNEKNLTYKLRKTNNNSRLEKGYWFLGNEDYLVISFWAGTDWKNKTPNIYLTCEPSGKFSLVFTSRDSSIKAKFLQNLATILPDFKQGKSKGKTIAYWEKILAQPSDAKSFLEILDIFLKTDKKIIDTFISNEIEVKKNGLDGIGFINQEDFNKNLQRILSYRKSIDNIPQRAGRVNRNGQSNNNEPPLLKLKELRLENIGHFRNLTLNLNHRIICLLGENGIGKSTILRAILLGLVGVDETSEIEIERKELQQLLRITGEGKGLPTFVSKGFISLDYTIDKPYTNQVEFDRIKGESSIRIKDASINNRNSFGATQSGNFLINLVVGFSQIQSKEKAKTTNLEVIKQPHVNDLLPLLYDLEDNRFQDLADWIIKLHAASNNNNEVEKEVIDFIFKVVSEIVGESVVLKKVNHLDKLLWVQLNGKNAILFRLISQGFRNVFAWVGHFIKRLAEANDYATDFMNHPAILLIDEIDTYLHPKWQKNILRVLAQKFPNTQIIITTHSPLVASHLPTKSKAVYIIKEDEVIPVKHIYGKEIASVFYQWMDVKERPQAIQDKIDSLFVELDKENMEAAKQLYDELKINLGEDDEALVEAKTYMQLVEN